MVGSQQVLSRQKRSRRPLALIGPAQIVVLFAIAFGWAMREDRWFVPQAGLGYGFGIAGLTLMTLLLVYPLRKRIQLFRTWGRISDWFEIHMLLGLLGPLAVLYHANFRLGSFNANIALFTTLTVAASGVIGRVIYRHIHEKLSGRKKTLAEMRLVLDATRETLSGGEALSLVRDCLVDFEECMLGKKSKPTSFFSAMLATPWKARATRRRAFRSLESRQHQLGTDQVRMAQASVRKYLRAVKSVAEFSVYERVFGLWHVAHLPLAVLLYGTAMIHVVAVHMY
jgi:hypothetical protein